MLTTIKIGNKISEARKRAGISQAQLAGQLFISSQAVGKWERGESMPDIITFNRIAEILGVDLNYFSDGPGQGFNQPFSPEAPVPGQDATKEVKQGGKLPWNMSSGNWVDADFSGLKNLGEKFGSSNMLRCLFINSELAGLLLKNNNVTGCDFTGSDFSGSQIKSSNLGSNLFMNCSMKQTEFSGSYLNGCNFSGADFTGALLKSGGLEKCNLESATWNNTSFLDLYLADLTFDGTLQDCYFENCSFSRVTFLNATLLNTFFRNRSMKRVRFSDCKADRMTIEFLKSGKADLSGITLL